MPLKTLQYELSGWMGMDRFTPETECDPHFWYDLQNMDCSEGGATKKRTGAQGFLLTLSNTINLIYDHQSQFNFGTDTDRQRTLVVSGAVLSVIKSFSTQSSSLQKTFSTTDAIHYAVTDDLGVTFITNENGGPVKMLFHDGTQWVFQNADFLSPSTACTVEAGATTSFTYNGTFQVRQSYVDTWGNESPLGAESAGITLNTLALNASVVVSTDSSVAHAKFYVLGPGMTDYQYSGTASNTTGTFSHSMSIAELMAGDLAPTYLVPAPEGKFITMYYDMLLVAGDPNVPDTVWAGYRQYHRQWGDYYSRAVSGDGQAIKGFGDSFDRKLVFKDDCVMSCEGICPETFRVRDYVKQFGAVGQGAIVQAANRAAWYSDDGFYLDDGQLPKELSLKIIDYVRKLNAQNIVSYQGVPSKLTAAVNKYAKQAVIATRETATAGVNDVLLSWDYQKNAWTKYSGNVPCIMGVVQNSNDLEYLYGGNNSGKVWLFTPESQGVYDDTISSTASTTISCYAETPWMHLPKLKGVGDWEQMRTIPRYLMIYASGVAAAGQTQIHLDCSYYVDMDISNKVASFQVKFTPNATYPLKPDKQKIGYGGTVGTFNWIKWRFEHAYLGEHIRIHKLIFAFRPKPSIG